MHLGPAQLLVGGLLAGGHPDQRRPAEEHLGPLPDHDGVVGQAREVGAAGRRVAEDEGHGGDAGPRQPGQVAEHRPAGDEDLGLGGQVGPAGLDQLDQRQAVALGDLHGPQGLAEPERVGGPAADGRVAGRDHALDPRHRPDAGDAAGPDGEVGPPGGQRRQLQERAVAVQQQLDPLPGQQLAPGPVAVDVLLAAARPGLGQQPVQLGQQLQVGGPVGPVGVRARVEPAPEHAHPQPPHSGYRKVTTGRGPAPDRAQGSSLVWWTSLAMTEKAASDAWLESTNQRQFGYLEVLL